MASVTACEAAELFFTEFQARRQGIEHQIQQSPHLPKEQLPAHFTLVLQKIDDLEKSITKANAFIPSYDEQQYSQQIKDLSTSLERAKSQLTPKPKFTFKSRRKNEPTEQTQLQSLQPVTTVQEPTTATVETAYAEQDHTVVWSDKADQILSLNEVLKEKKSTSVSVLLSNLTRCVIDLKINSTVQVPTLHIKNLKECVIVSSTIQGSVLIYGLTQSTIALHCHQFRMHDAKNVDILLNVSSHPIIEDSAEIRVGRYQHGEAASSTNFYDCIEDFNWHKKQSSPNWSFLEGERVQLLAAAMNDTPRLGLHFIPPSL